MEITGKRFLITQPMMHWICGSTIVTLELAEYLKSQGAKVTIYTCFYDEPLKSICQKRKIKVHESKNRPQYKLTDFDYIWVHSQILPLSLVEALGKKLPSKMPAFIFLHMSGMDWIPDEKPWIYNLENLLSSKSLFICEEIKKVNQPMLDKNIDTGYFENPAPLSFAQRTAPPKSKLHDILIISNHPPQEIEKAKQILRTKHHVNVQSLGEDEELYKILDINTLSQFDAVITIAKTATYCLVSGTPVYVYDSFGGGVGWLTKDNFKQAKKRNFSGYQNKFYPDYIGGGFVKKTAEQIVKEILTGYANALKYQTTNQPKFQKEFIINEIFPQLLANIQPRQDIQKFPSDYKDMVLASQDLANKHFEWASIIHNLDDIIENLNNQNSYLQDQIQELKSALSAKSYQLYSKLITPYQKIKAKKQ